MLSFTQEEAVLQEVRRSGIESQDSANRIVRDALNAIVSGKADEAAYRVAEAAGTGFIGTAIWYQEEFRMTAEQARTVLTQAKQEEIYEGDIPKDDATAISEAQDIVDMAEQAWDQHVRGPQVETIRNLAQSFVSENGDQAEAEAEETPDFDPETGEVIEPEHEEEKAPEAPQSDPELSSIEPWDGYNSEKLASIYEALEVGMETDDSPAELLAHVWAFETAHKNRKRIINRLEEYANRLKGTPKPEPKQDEPEPEPEPEKTPEPEPEPEPNETLEAAQRAARAEEPEEIPEAKAEAKTEAKAEVEVEDKGDRIYDDLMESIDAEIKRENLHIPPKLPEERPKFPEDLTTISAQDLQQLYMAFAGYAYRTNYLLTRQEHMAMRCKEALTELTNALLVQYDKYDEHGKQKTMTILEAEVSQDENVKTWRRRHRKHEQFAHFYRSERDAYQRYVESLSRLETMRHNEFERGGK